MDLIDKNKLDSFKYRSASERMDLPVDYMAGWNDAVDGIMANAPTVEAEPVRHGKWIDPETFKRPWFRHHIFECSVCRNTLDMDGVNAGRGDANYCPNCGAKMDERAEE